MSADIYRRCGCRKEDGRAYPRLPAGASDKQKASACPLLHKDPKHGSWGYAVYGTDRATGERIQALKMGFDTKQKAKQARAKVVQEVGEGRYRGDQKMTVGEFLPQWLEERERGGLRPSTAYGYRQVHRGRHRARSRPPASC